MDGRKPTHADMKYLEHRDCPNCEHRGQLWYHIGWWAERPERVWYECLACGYCGLVSWEDS